MKYIFAGLVLIHGAIHLMGFVKAFGLAQVDQLKVSISRFAGIFWLLSSLLFFLAGAAYLTDEGWWFIPAFIAVFTSTVLVIFTWTDAKFGTIANVVILAAATVGYGSWSFSRIYQDDVIKGLKKTDSGTVSLLTEEDITGLPGPVKKYIRYTGAVGKPKVHNFRIEFTGKIRKDEQSEWMDFTSGQYNFLDSPTRLFFMKAEMKQLPVAGYHAYRNGTASMDIRLLSLFRVQYQSGKEMNIAETVTFFNDMCCMAPATLIDHRIKWTGGDSTKVNAAFTNNGITVSAWLYFNAKGELVNFVSDDRYAAGDNNKMQRLRWFTPLKDYREIDGYRLAGNADAVYTYPEGEVCYGTFSLTHINYNCEHFMD